MKLKTFLFATLLLPLCGSLNAQVNNIVVQDSNDLFYNIVDYRLPGVEVTYPNKKQCDLWKGHTLPSGIIIFPGTIHYNDRTYEVAEVAPWTFSNCTGIVDVKFTDHLQALGFSSFAFCEGLTEIQLPNSVNSIGGCAFLACRNLRKVNIPEAVTVIKGHTFADCVSLTSITLPKELTRIGRSAFDRSGLTSIVIPAKVNEIAPYAFRKCAALASVKVQATMPPVVAENAFDEIAADAVLLVPAGSRTAYMGDPAWSRFSRIEEF